MYVVLSYVDGLATDLTILTIGKDRFQKLLQGSKPLKQIISTCDEEERALLEKIRVNTEGK